MAVRQDEAIAIWPDRVLWIEAHDLVPDNVDQRRERHRRARMAGLRLLDCIDGKRADRIDRELIELLAGQAFQLCFLHWEPSRFVTQPVSLPASRHARRTRNA